MGPHATRSPSGERIVLATTDSDLEVWTTDTRRQMEELDGDFVHWV